MIAILLSAVAAIFARLLLRGGRAQWPAVVVALLFGLGGYALTGSPTRPAQSAKPAFNDSTAFPELLAARQKLLPFNGEAGAWITFADARARQGHAQDGIDALKEAIRRQPRNAALWTALGNALLLHAEGLLTPAAELAYARAAALAPNDPAPPAFRAVAVKLSGADMPLRETTRR